MRTEFSNPVKRAANERANGICECYRLIGVPGLIPGGCNQRLGPGNRFHEHVNPDGNGGPATLDNCAVLTKTCWKIKTHKYDQPLVAKTKRILDTDEGINRKGSRRLPCGKNSEWKMPLNGWHAERRV